MFANRFRLNWPDHVLHFGGGQQGPSDEERKAAAKRQAEQDRAMQQMLAQMSKQSRIEPINIPPPPAPIAIPPPPTQSQTDIEAAQLEARRGAAKRYGFLKTRYAGSTGGYTGTPLGSSNAGASAVLG